MAFTKEELEEIAAADAEIDETFVLTQAEIEERIKQNGKQENQH